MLINTVGQIIGSQMVNATTGGPFAGTVTVYVTVDAGTQAIGSVGGGICTAAGDGYYFYRPSQAETNGSLIGFTFVGVGAVPSTIQVQTLTPAQQANLAAGQPGPGSIQATSLIRAALQTIGVYQVGEAIEANQMYDGLAILQRMMSLWRLSPLMSPTNVRETFPLISGKGGPSNPYTVGVGGDFNTTRPISVTEITGWALILGTTAYPYEVEIPRAMLTDDMFRAIQMKDLPNPLFTSAYYNPTYAGGLGSVILWPVESNSNDTFVWYRDLPIVTFPSLLAVVDLPEGVEEAVVYNLAMRFCTPYGKAMPADVPMFAARSLAEVKRMNTRLTDLATDPALTQTQRGGYNIVSGTGG